MKKTLIKTVKFVAYGHQYTGTIFASRDDEVDVINITPPLVGGYDAATVPKGITVSRPCDACEVDVPTNEHCGDDGQYLCPDCYSQQRADQMYIHDWLIMLVDFDWTTDVRIAIHKDVATPKAIDSADCSSPDPDDDISRFGPGTSAHTLGMDDIDGLHADVNTVYCLVDDGLIDGKKATLIFKTQGGAA